MGTNPENDRHREVGADVETGAEQLRVAHLGVADIPAISELEAACWSPEIRADEQTLRRRFELGHITLGLQARGKLVGVTSFGYSQCGTPTLNRLPRTFREFSSQPRHEDPDSAYVYNLNIHPDHRGTTMTRRLVLAGLSRLSQDGCDYLVGAVRCPSYNGSLSLPFERIEHSPSFRAMVDQHLLRGTTPSTKELTADPLLRFYHRVLSCEFLGIIPDFLPGDAPSGGHGVIFYKQLHKCDSH